MSRLNNQMKDVFISKLVAKTYKEDVNAAMKAIVDSTVADDLYDAIVPKKIQQALIDMNFRDEITELSLGRYKAGCAVELYVPLSKPRVAMGGCVSSSHWNAFTLTRDKKSRAIKITGGTAKSEAKHQEEGKKTPGQILNEKLAPVAKKHQKILRTFFDLQVERDEFTNTLTRSISGLRTIKSLKALSPEIAQAWDEIMGEEGKEMSLPAMIPDSVNKKLKEKMPFPKEVKEVEKAA